jgi:hypothetical protein
MKLVRLSQPNFTVCANITLNKMCPLPFKLSNESIFPLRLLLNDDLISMSIRGTLQKKIGLDSNTDNRVINPALSLTWGFYPFNSNEQKAYLSLAADPKNISLYYSYNNIINQRSISSPFSWSPFASVTVVFQENVRSFYALVRHCFRSIRL